MNPLDAQRKKATRVGERTEQIGEQLDRIRNHITNADVDNVCRAVQELTDEVGHLAAIAEHLTSEPAITEGELAEDSLSGMRRRLESSREREYVLQQQLYEVNARKVALAAEIARIRVDNADALASIRAKLSSALRIVEGETPQQSEGDLVMLAERAWQIIARQHGELNAIYAAWSKRNPRDAL